MREQDGKLFLIRPARHVQSSVNVLQGKSQTPETLRNMLGGLLNLIRFAEQINVLLYIDLESEKADLRSVQPPQLL